MSNNIRNFEKEFISFERDIDLSKDDSMPVNKVNNSYMDSFLEQYQSPIISATLPVSTSEPTIHSEEPQEDVHLTEEPPVMNEVTKDHAYPPLTLDDMILMSEQLEKAIMTITPLHEQAQRMLTPDNDVRLPKGLRTTVSLLADILFVFIATKAIIDLFEELSLEPLYQTVDENRLKTTTRCTINTFMTHAPTIQEGLDDVENAMTEGYDRPSANLRMRIIKGQAVIIRSQAFQQAQALVQTIESFPIENGSLRVLCLLEEKGDTAIMNSIDHTMEIAHHIQVPVAEAPKMLEAIINDDNKTVEAIVNRMIEQL